MVARSRTVAMGTVEGTQPHYLQKLPQNQVLGQAVRILFAHQNNINIIKILHYFHRFNTNTVFAQLCRSVDKSTAQRLSQTDLFRSPPSLLLPSRQRPNVSLTAFPDFLARKFQIIFGLKTLPLLRGSAEVA